MYVCALAGACGRADVRVGRMREVAHASDLEGCVSDLGLYRCCKGLALHSVGAVASECACV